MTNISHEQRSPLTSIMGYLDLLKKRHYKTEEDFEEYVNTIYSKSQKLKVLIDELLEYAKLSSTVLNLLCLRRLLPRPPEMLKLPCSTMSTTCQPNLPKPCLSISIKEILPGRRKKAQDWAWLYLKKSSNYTAGASRPVT